MKHAQDLGGSSTDTAYQLGHIRALIYYTLHFTPSSIAHLSPGRLDIDFDSMDKGPDGRTRNTHEGVSLALQVNIGPQRLIHSTLDLFFKLVACIETVVSRVQDKDDFFDLWCFRGCLSTRTLTDIVKQYLLCIQVEIFGKDLR